MKISELDSYNLKDAIKFHLELNPKLWSGRSLIPAVRKHLMLIAQDFREFLGIPDLEVKDITISGSNAAYTYTDHSDIDLHLIVEVEKLDHSDVYRELFNSKKYQYNDQHLIKIYGYTVEVYVQDAKQTHTSQGIYSILNNDWIKLPEKQRATINDISTKSKYETTLARINSAIQSTNMDQAHNVWDEIKDMRKSGLAIMGEFGPENLTFKMLRAQGVIKKLIDHINSLKNHSLSLEQANMIGTKNHSKEKIDYASV